MNQYNNNNPWKRGTSKRARTAAAVVNRKDEPTNTVKVRASSQPVPMRKLSSVYDFQDLQGIGVGAFANVFRGREMISRNPDQWRVVALKRINLCAITEPALLKSTVNEVNLFKSFNHENIVKCFYSFEEISIHSNNKYLVLVLEYIDGGDLDQWIKTNSNQYQALIPEADIWRLFKQIANAVAYIHSKHIMHRDLKPPNVLLTSDGIVKLADFGLSRLQNLGESRAETVCGTPYYMSPERINESPYSAKSDVWSLGCILYEMATLRSPFFGEKENVNSLITKIQNAEYPPIPDDCYTRQLEFVIEACLNPKMEARPTAEEIRVMAERMTEHWGV